MYIRFKVPTSIYSALTQKKRPTVLGTQLEMLQNVIYFLYEVMKGKTGYMAFITWYNFNQSAEQKLTVLECFLGFI